MSLNFSNFKDTERVLLLNIWCSFTFKMLTIHFKVFMGPAIGLYYCKLRPKSCRFLPAVLNESSLLCRS